MANRVTLQVAGMDCPSCASKIEGAVCALPGVDNVRLNYTSQRLVADVDENASTGAISQVVEKLGYTVSQPGGAPAAAAVPWWWTNRGRLVIMAGALLALATLLSFTIPASAFYVYSAAALLALWPLARKAVAAMAAGQPFTIETLVSIAVIGAIIIDQAAEAAVVVFLFLIGEMLEMVAAAKARRSVQALGDLVPKTARLVTGDGTSEVAAADLAIDDVVEIRPGDRIPADGIIISGETAVDESSVTGESMPRRRQPGDSVYAGSINADGLIRVRVSKSAENNMIARILHMVEEAEASRAPTARFIDRFSRYYTPGVILVSALIAIFPPVFMDAQWLPWIYKGLAILLIGCPCALVLSTPAAITSGLAAGARQGLLIKGGAILEAIGRIRRMAFDKTGTLTEGTPKVTDIIALDGNTGNLLGLAASIETGSSHPLALAIVEEAIRTGLDIPPARDNEALRGRGVRGRVGDRMITVASPRYTASLTAMPDRLAMQVNSLEAAGKTVAMILADDRLLGLVALRDELRADARAAVDRLSAMGIEAIMLTGDNARTGTALANRLGIEVRAELLPQDKLEAIEELRQSGSIAMVGDGINDAPALARADIGIAMGGGTDVALETADAALLHQRVGDVPALVSLSRATMANIHQNITLALGLKAVFLLTTLFGVTSLWMAILADTGATVLVTLNALRLLRYRSRSMIRPERSEDRQDHAATRA